jgi:hypothetical protein
MQGYPAFMILVLQDSRLNSLERILFAQLPRATPLDEMLPHKNVPFPVHNEDCPKEHPPLVSNCRQIIALFLLRHPARPSTLVLSLIDFQTQE